MDWVGQKRGRVGDYRSSVGNNVGRGSIGFFHVGHTLVLHVSDEPVLVVRVIGHDLHTAVRKLDTVFSCGEFLVNVRICVQSFNRFFSLPWTTP